MTPDFDAPIDRRGTHSLKWDVGADELPMWVADMDFAAAAPIRQALQRRLDNGVFGYTMVPDEYAAAVAGWWTRRHGWAVDPAWVGLTTGVVPAISSIVRTLTQPGEPVVVAPPVYNIFFNSIVNSGRIVLPSPLRRDPDTDAYEIDWDDLDAKLAQTRLLIWCNPHNPVGRIWSADELARVGELAATHGVTVLSDEIHCDVVAPGHAYVPYASIAPANSITCVAPTKAFNLAGLQTASVIVPDAELRAAVMRGLNRDEVAEPNAFAIDATIAAFTHGEPWLDAARAYIQANKHHAVDVIDAIPGLRAAESLATYLLWIDATALTDDSVALCAHLRATTGLYVSDGAEYGGDGAGFLRMNLACPRARVDDGLDRLRRGIATWNTKA
ncbi:MAG: pyridoxal phosphate-dependent aminotransferase [Propionibacteriaceae bacterium]|nr:pyridoxal phosphate-dependent aminotransferase [Propionibacteriaceae bacterium]